MVELLMGSVAITIKYVGYSYKNHLYASRFHKSRNPCQGSDSWSNFGLHIKVSRRCAKINVYNYFVVEGQHHSSGPMCLRIGGSNRLARAASRDDVPVIDGEVACCKNAFVEKEHFDVGAIDYKLPPWGSLAIEEKTEFQFDSLSRTTVSPKGKVIKKENKLQFLEETDEEVLSVRILKLSRSNKLASALSLYRSMEFSGLRPNLHACNSLLACLLRNHMLDEALRIFGSMKEREMTTSHTYSLILKSVANARGYNVAHDMFDDLLGRSNLKKEFDAVVYNTMLSIYGKVNDWVQTERIWRIMKDNDHVGTILTYRLLVCIFVRCSQNELALDAYHEMIQYGVEPTDDAMQAIIGACSKEGKWDMALSVFQKMLDQGLKPNAVACNALINLLGKAGEIDLALKVYGTMKSLGHITDAYTWNAILGALYRANEHADVLRLFQKIQIGKNSKLNLHIYNTALMSCQRLGSWDRAVQLLWQMEHSGLPISTASYNLVIGTCEVARRPKMALQVYERMLHQGYTPDLFTLLSLIRGCVWGSLWDEIEQILDQVPQNASLYNVAIQGMLLRGRIDSAKKFYRKMQEIGFKPDGKTRALMLQNMRKRSVRKTKRRRLTRQ